VATTTSNIGVALDAMGKHADAMAYHKRALDWHRRAQGGDHPAVATDLNNLAWAEMVAGSEAESDELWEEALRVLEASLGPEHPELVEMLRYSANALRRRGRYSDAA